jgi:hypothetical protein
MNSDHGLYSDITGWRNYMEEITTPSKKLYWIGWGLSVLPSLALLLSGIVKFLPVTPDTEQGLQHIGWRAEQLPTLGILEIAVVIVYLIPQTAVLGAILVTAYMGGTIATHLRVGDPFVIQILIGILFWLGLWLRDGRLRELLPIRK